MQGRRSDGYRPGAEWWRSGACGQLFVGLQASSRKGGSSREALRPCFRSPPQALIIKMLREKQERDTTDAIINGEDVEVRGDWMRLPATASRLCFPGPSESTAPLKPPTASCRTHSVGSWSRPLRGSCTVRREGAAAPSTCLRPASPPDSAPPLTPPDPAPRSRRAGRHRRRAHHGLAHRRPRQGISSGRLCL